MPREIERKFLLRDDSWRDHAAGSRVLRQGYLDSTRPYPAPDANAGTAPDAGATGVSVRVRTVGEERALLNIKAGGLVASRLEFEYEIPIADALELLALCRRPLIEKVRHHVYIGDAHWEIDEFLGDNAGLIVAEIELDSEDQAIEPPAWLGVEVTAHRRYYNVCLVDHPFATWSEAERCPSVP